MAEGDTVRWVWGHDQAGRRVTEAEAVGFAWCEECKAGHPTRWVTRHLRLRPLPGMEGARVAGVASALYHPDDDA